jgi:hypothetical protein
MRVTANKTPDRGGKPRRWRETNTYRNWREAVFQDYNYECAVTGAKSQKTSELRSERSSDKNPNLYCAKENPHLLYVTENGIVLKKDVFSNFHKQYKYGKNTVEQFNEFLLFLFYFF